MLAEKKTIHIIVADDDEDDRALFEMAVKELNTAFELTVLNDGPALLSFLDSHKKPDIIFLDLNMPKMNGFECLKQLKKSELYKHIPVVVLSTSNREEDIEKCRELGAAS